MSDDPKCELCGGNLDINATLIGCQNFAGGFRRNRITSLCPTAAEVVTHAGG